MSRAFRLTRPEELVAPGEMKPALVFRVSFKTIANVVAETAGKKGSSLFFTAGMAMRCTPRLDDVPLVMIPLNHAPREVHIYAEDRNGREGRFV
jgi:hypothetical protein